MNRDLKNLTIFGNLANQATLKDFRILMNDYFGNVSWDSYYPEGLVENDTARTSRAKINLELAKVVRAASQTKIDRPILYSPPMGGRIQGRVNLLENFFVLGQMEINSQFEV